MNAAEKTSLIHEDFEYVSIINGSAFDNDLYNCDVTDLINFAQRKYVLVLNNFNPLNKSEFIGLASKFGELLEWKFGYVLELEIKENTENYLFTSGNVPYHWDGAFAEKVPRFLFFQCLHAKGSGGESTFCDTSKVLELASAAQRKLWKA